MTSQTVARANRRNVHTFVAARQPFQGSNITGRHAKGITGQLPMSYRTQYEIASGATDFYVVHSYQTPIAWFAHGKWFVPNVRYSPTTSRQQSALGLVKDGSVWGSDAPWALFEHTPDA
jgi:hypothetical protein